MTAYERHCLKENMAAVHANRRLRSGDVEDRDVYDVALLATGDEEVAAEMLASRVRTRLRANQRPEIY